MTQIPNKHSAHNTAPAEMQRLLHFLWLLWPCTLLWTTPTHAVDEQPEYQVKAAYLYNFMRFVEWPKSTGPVLNLCIYGDNPFGEGLDNFKNKKVNERDIVPQHKVLGSDLNSCQIVFISTAAIGELAKLMPTLNQAPILTVADSTEAAAQGVILNMTLVGSKIAFEANLRTARTAGLTISSKLLRLAAKVQQ